MNLNWGPGGCESRLGFGAGGPVHLNCVAWRLWI